MTLTLRPFVDVAPIPDGVYVSGPTSQFVMKGWSGLYQVASVCVQLLARGATEPELVEVLGTPKAQPVVRRILDGLSAHGMLLNREDVGGLEAKPHGMAGEALAFLEAVSSEPRETFERLRGRKLAVRGLPTNGAAVVSALLEIGFGQASRSASDSDADVVLYCVARPEDLSSDTLPGAADTLVVPVLLGDILRVAGPVVSRTDLPSVSEIWKRADRWRPDGTTPVAETTAVADAFALGFAGHLLFDALAGLATDTFVVVHGDQLAVDRPAYAPRPAVERSTRYRLESVDSAELAIAQVLAAVVDMSHEWTGLFTSGSGEKALPQVPLALREIALREGPRENVASWGPDQEVATMAVAVDGLRLIGAAPAGLTAERWLLDGVLRLLVDQVTYASDLTNAMYNADGHRVRRALEVLGAAELHLTVGVLPGVDWPMVSVHDRGGVLLAAAWAEDEKLAGFEALATVLANQQAAAAGQTATMSRLRTGRLVYGDSERIGQLRAQVCNYLASCGRRAEGCPRGPDPVLGQLPFWTGLVQLVPTERVR